MFSSVVAPASPQPAPRVLVGEFTRLVGPAPDFDPLPEDQQVAEPIFAYDHAAIDRDCDVHCRMAGPNLKKEEARRERLHHELDLAIKAAEPGADPVFGLILDELRADREFDRACAHADSVALGREPTAEELAAEEAADAKQEDAFIAVMSCTPLTAAGAIEMLNLFDTREMHKVCSPVDGQLTNLFASLRCYLDPVGWGFDQVAHPIDVLWADWHARTLSFSDDTKGMSDNESEPIYDAIWDVTDRIEASPPSSMRAAALALVEVYHEVSDLSSPRTPASFRAGARNSLGRMTLLVLESLRPSLSGAIRRCVDDLLDNPDVPIVQSILHCGDAPFAKPAVLQAAE